MRPTEELMTEHRAIERMLAVLEEALDRLRRGEQVRPGLFREAVDFVRNFADGCHHRKEEDTLFPRLEAAGVPREGGPLGVMLFEHDLGRQYIAGIEGGLDAYEAGDAGAIPVIGENVANYTGLLREHIKKEDHILFPMADRVLGEAEQIDLEQRFQSIEEDVMGPGVHERYHALLDALEEELGLA